MEPGEGNVLDNIDAENLNDRDNQEIDVVPLASPVEEAKTDSDDENDNILRVSTDNKMEAIDELLEVDSPESPLSDDEPVLTTPKYDAVPTQQEDDVEEQVSVEIAEDGLEEEEPKKEFINVLNYEIINKFFDFLDTSNSKELNSTLSGYFCRVTLVLI